MKPLTIERLEAHPFIHELLAVMNVADKILTENYVHIFFKFTDFVFANNLDFFLSKKSSE